MKGSTIRVLVVDDFDPWRDFVSKTLREYPELQVIANARDGIEGVQQAKALNPDLILLDIGLPKLNGIEASRRIKQVLPACKILFTSEDRSPDIVEEAMRTGAGGYIVKSNATSDLLPAIDAVLRGKQFVSACLNYENSVNNAHPASCEKIFALSVPSRGERHSLRLYRDDSAFVDGLCRSIEDTLEHGNASVIIATESHRSGLCKRLRTDGVDIATAVEKSLLVFLDVDSLSTLVDSATDEDRPTGSIRPPEVILEALRTTKDMHLHTAVT